MIIENVRVRNFRSLLSVDLPCESLTAIVGRNGAGKSSFLHALEMFYNPSAKVAPQDCYDGDTAREVEITVTYSHLSSDETSALDDYLIDGKLEITRVIVVNGGPKSATYHGTRPQNPDFASVRGAGGKREQTAAYNELRSQAKYKQLPSVRSADAALDAMNAWESAHREACVPGRDDGRVFGFGGGGVGDLSRYTEFVRIPAVRDAADDATEGRGSGVTEMMDLVVRNALATREDVANFKVKTQAGYEELLNPERVSQLATLEGDLNDTLRCYAPSSRVSLSWRLPPIQVPLPQAEITLWEDDYESDVGRTGHGLQRAFILTLLQHLAAARRRQGDSSADDDRAAVDEQQTQGSRLPTLVLAIEEPELYQHPTRQRLLARVLMDLAHGSIPGVAARTQVIYTTHSPLFVGLERFDQIRLLRKTDGGSGNPNVTAVAVGDLDDAAQELWRLDGERGDPYTAETLTPRMIAVMSPRINEGFFADLVVLVEGDGDAAALAAMASILNIDLDALGVAVIPCRGKRSMDRPTIAFRQLGIDTYLVWDNDKEGHQPRPHENRRLLRLVGAPEENWPQGAWATHACVNGNMEKLLREELSSTVFDALLDQVRSQMRMKRKDALKNPYVLARIVQEAAIDGKTSKTLSDIVRSIARKRGDSGEEAVA